MTTDRPRRNDPALRYGLVGLGELAMTAFLSRLFRRPRVDAPAWIEVGELQRRLAAGDAVVLVDVRQPEEFTAPPGHLPGAVNVPLADLSGRAGELAARREPVVLVCKTRSPICPGSNTATCRRLTGCRRPSWRNRRVAPTRAGSRIVMGAPVLLRLLCECGNCDAHGYGRCDD